MAQPIAGNNFKTISGGVGTAAITDQGANIVRVIIPGTYVGTLVLHNAPSATGTNSASPVATFGLPATGIPQSVEVGVWCGRGITYEATGTPVMTVVWG